MFGRLLRKDEPGEQRAMQTTPWGDWGTGTYGSAAGMPVTTESSIQLLAVYGSVQMIAETIATLPRDVYRQKSNDLNEEVLIKPRWFEQPNPQTDIIEFLTQSLHSLLLDGNAYWAYNVDLNFAPTDIRVLNPLMVDVRPSESRTDPSPQYFINGAKFTGKLLHIKGLTAPGALKGLSPVESARQSIGIGLAVQEFAGNFYKNGTTLSGVISVPGRMTADEAKELKQNWSRGHGGVANAHLPGVITNGAAWTPISVTPEQSMFLESRQFQAGEICAQMFLLDPSMLGIAAAGTRGQNLTYANLADRYQHMVQSALMRWIIRLERAFTFLLPKPQFMKFNVDAIQRADLKTRYEAHRIALGTNVPFETVNEIRDLEDLPPLPGGDTLPEPPAALPTAQPAVQVPNMNGYRNRVQPMEIHNHVHMADAAPITVHGGPTYFDAPINVEQPQLTFPPTEINNYVEIPPAQQPVNNIYVDPAPQQLLNVTVAPEAQQPAVVHNHIEAAPAPDVNVTVQAAEPAPPAEINVYNDQPAADVTVNIDPPPPAEIHAHFEPADVNVDVNVEPAAPTEVTVNLPEPVPADVYVNVEASPAPNVDVVVEPTEVVVHNTIKQPPPPPPRKVRKNIIRDENNRVTGVEEEE